MRIRAITKANYIGASRILVWTPLAAAAVLTEQWNMAAVAIALSGVSDLLDGLVARHENTMSRFGVFLDLTADKVFVSAILTCLAYRGLIPLWIPLAVILREFLVMGLRAFAAAEQLVIPADKLGGAKIVTTFIATIAVVLRLAVGSYLMMLAVALTIVSGVAYFYRARHLLVRELYYPSIEAK